MSLSFKQFQDLLCKNGCGFMARPTLQGYCPKCWADKCLPSSCVDKDSNRQSEPNLSSVTPVPKANKSNQKRGSKESHSRNSDVGDNGKVSSPSSGPSNQILPDSDLSTENQNTMPPVLLSGLHTDRTESRATDKTTPDVENQKTTTSNSIAVRSASPIVVEYKRSPSPDLIVLDEIKKPEPELIVIDDTDDDVVQIEPEKTSKLSRKNTVRIRDPQTSPDQSSARNVSTPPRHTIPSPISPRLSEYLPQLPSLQPERSAQLSPALFQNLMISAVNPNNKNPIITELPKQTTLSPILPTATLLTQPVSTAVSTPMPTSILHSVPTSVPHPISTTHSLPTSVSQPMPTPVSQPMPTPVSQPMPTPVSQPMPTPVSQPMPTPVSQPMPTHVSQPMPTPVSQPMPTHVSQLIPTSVSQPMPTSVSRPLSTAIPHPMPTSVSHPMPVAVSHSNPTPILNTKSTSATQPNQVRLVGISPSLLHGGQQVVLMQNQISQSTIVGSSHPSVRFNTPIMMRSIPTMSPGALSVLPTIPTSATKKSSRYYLITKEITTPQPGVLTSNSSAAQQITMQPAVQQILQRPALLAPSIVHVSPPAGSKTSKRPIILRKSPIKTIVNKQASNKTNVVIETHPVAAFQGGTSDKHIVSPVSVSKHPGLMALHPSVSRTSGSMAKLTTVSSTSGTSGTVTNTSTSSTLWGEWRKRFMGDVQQSGSAPCRPAIVSASAPGPQIIPAPASRRPQSSSREIQTVLSRSNTITKPSSTITKPPQPTRLLQMFPNTTWMNNSKSAPTSNVQIERPAETSTIPMKMPFASMIQRLNDRLQESQVQSSSSTSGMQCQPVQGMQVQIAKTIHKRNHIKKPVHRLNRRPVHKCHYCRKKFCTDIRHFRNHLWMHRQKYRPYWYEAEEDGSGSRKKSQIGRRPFMLLYPSTSKRKRKLDMKSDRTAVEAEDRVVCRFCPLLCARGNPLILHENAHTKAMGYKAGRCSVCEIDLSWHTKLTSHFTTARHMDNLRIKSKKGTSSSGPSDAASPQQGFVKVWQSPQVVGQLPQVVGQSLQVVVQSPQVVNQWPQVNQLPHIVEQSTQVVKPSTQVVKLSPLVVKQSPQVVEQSPQVAGQLPQVASLSQGKKGKTHKGLLLPKYFQGPPYKCPHCDMEWNYMSKLLNHIKLHRKDYKCLHCKEGFSNEKQFQIHMTRCSSRKFINAAKLLATKKPSKKQTHITPFQADRPYSCNRCGTRFKHAKSRINHNRNTQCALNHRLQKKNNAPPSAAKPQKILKCVYCDAIFHHAKTLMSHQLMHTRNSLYQNICNVCGASFAQAELLSTHRRVHDIEMPYSCEQCSSRFSKQEDLNDHVRQKHPNIKTHVCQQCSAQFVDQNELARHIQSSHNLQKSSTEGTIASFGCLYCGKTFKDRKVLVIHQETHNTSTAGKQVAHSNVLAQSVQKRASAEPVQSSALAAAKACYICLICGKEYRNQLGLAGHMSSAHKKDSQFKCQTCSKTYPTKTALVYHAKSHSQALRKPPLVKVPPTARQESEVEPAKLVAENELFSRSGVLKRILGSDDVSQISVDPVCEGLSVKVSASGDNRVTDRNEIIINAQISGPNPITTRQDLKGTKKAKGPSQLKKCRYCKRLCLSEAKWKSHEKWHTEYRPYKCKHCHNRFKKKCYLMKHKRHHLPYGCNACKESFVTYMAYVYHVVSVHKKHKEFFTTRASTGSLPNDATLKPSDRGHRCVYCCRKFCRDALRIRTHIQNHLACYKKFRYKHNKVKSKISAGGSVIGDVLLKTVETATDGKDNPKLAKNKKKQSTNKKKMGVEQHMFAKVFTSKAALSEPQTLKCLDCHGLANMNRGISKGDDDNVTPLEVQCIGSIPSENIISQFACLCGKNIIFDESKKQLHQKQDKHGNSIPERKVSSNKSQSSNEQKCMVKQHTEAPYKCNDCDQCFSLWRLREEHVRRVHKNFTCQYCQKTFLVYQILMRHEKKHKTEGKTTQQTKKMPLLEQEEHSKEDDKGEDNYKTGTDLTNVKKKKEPFSESSDNSADSESDGPGMPEDDSSDTDGQTNTNVPEKLKLNDKSAESDKPLKENFRCEKCERSFRSQVYLLQHGKVHAIENQSDDLNNESEKEFKCKHCDRSFGKHGHLLQHNQIHEQQQYQCELCPRSFRKYLLLLRHNKKTHPGHKVTPSGSKSVEEEQTYTCSVCFENFTDKDKMVEHKKIHAKQSTFVCHICNTAFNQSWDLIVHKRSHTRVELRLISGPSTCSKISTVTAATSCDTTVTNISTSKGALRCSFCGFVCSDKSHLTLHEKTHTSAMFTCTFCGKAFKSNDLLLAHLNDVHYAQRSGVNSEDKQHVEKERMHRSKKKLRNVLDSSDSGDSSGEEKGMDAADVELNDFEGPVSDSKSEIGLVHDTNLLSRRVANKKYYEESSESDFEEYVGKNIRSSRSIVKNDVESSGPDVESNKRRSSKRVAKNYIETTEGESEINDIYDESTVRYPKRARSRKSYAEPNEQDLELDSQDNQSENEKIVSVNVDEPYKCTYCGIGFALENDWSFHEYQHAQNEPYRCQFCYKLFSRRSNLTKHEQSHKDRKSYRCIECDKHFAMATHLQYHTEREHSKPLPQDQSHQCTICRKYFSRQSNCTRHQKKCSASHQKHDSSSLVTERNAAKIARIQMSVNQTSSDDDDDGMDSGDGDQDGDINISHSNVTPEELVVDRCRFCKKTLPNKKSLMKHEIKVHKAKGSLQCGYCSHCFWYPCDKKRHEERHIKMKDKKNPPETIVCEKADSKDKPFECQLCNRFFSNENIFTIHKQTHLQEQSRKCKFCLKTFENGNDLTNHEKSHTAPEVPTSSFGCLFCHEMFNLKSALIDHIQTHSGRESYMCPHCDLTFPTSATLQAHEKEHLQPKSFQCYHCEAFFSDQEMLRQHEATHKENGFHCKICGNNFINRAGLSSHMRNQHSDARASPTDNIQARFRDAHQKVRQPIIRLQSLSPVSLYSPPALSYPSVLQSEVISQNSTPRTSVAKVHTNDAVDAIVNPYSCNICKESFHSPEHLKKHVRMHSKEQSRKCQYCGKEFSKVSTLRKHLRLHLRSLQSAHGSSAFKCQVCGINFKVKSALISHLKTHAKGKAKPFSFHKPNKAFSLKTTKSKQPLKMEENALNSKQQRAFNSSQKPSTALKDATCQYCHKTFYNKYKVLAHINTVHAKDRPHKCTECGFRFAIEAELTHHMISHKGDIPRPHGCNVCGYRFTKQSSLTNHMRRHKVPNTGAQRFNCKDCAKTFSKKSYLHKHEKIHLEKTDAAPEQVSFEASVTPPRKKLKTSNHRLGETTSFLSSKDSNQISGTIPTSADPHDLAQNFRCEVCEKIFAKKQYLIKHKKRHLKEEKARTDELSATLQRKKSNASNHPINKSVQSPENSSRNSESDFSTKVSKPTENRLLDCKYCNLLFTQLEDLIRHERTHPGEKPYSCEDCSKSYSDRSHLTIHRAKVHRPKETKTSQTKVATRPLAKPYPCNDCEKAYYKKANLRDHKKKMHTLKTSLTEGGQQNSSIVDVEIVGETSHPCDVCDKSFLRSVDLKQHYTRVHNPKEQQTRKNQKEAHEEIPKKPQTIFPCDICGKHFHRSSDLKQHNTRVHKPKESYLGKKQEYSSKKALTKPTDMLFSCDACNKRYYTKSHLKKHYNRVHTTLNQKTSTPTVPKNSHQSGHRTISSNQTDISTGIVEGLITNEAGGERKEHRLKKLVIKTNQPLSCKPDGGHEKSENSNLQSREEINPKLIIKTSSTYIIKEPVTNETDGKSKEDRLKKLVIKTNQPLSHKPAGGNEKSNNRNLQNREEINTKVIKPSSTDNITRSVTNEAGGKSKEDKPKKLVIKTNQPLSHKPDGGYEKSKNRKHQNTEEGNTKIIIKPSSTNVIKKSVMNEASGKSREDKLKKLVIKTNHPLSKNPDGHEKSKKSNLQSREEINTKLIIKPSSTNVIKKSVTNEEGGKSKEDRLKKLVIKTNHSFSQKPDGHEKSKMNNLQSTEEINTKLIIKPSSTNVIKKSVTNEAGWKSKEHRLKKLVIKANHSLSQKPDDGQEKSKKSNLQSREEINTKITKTISTHVKVTTSNTSTLSNPGISRNANPLFTINKEKSSGVKEHGHSSHSVKHGLIASHNEHSHEKVKISQSITGSTKSSLSVTGNTKTSSYVAGTSKLSTNPINSCKSIKSRPKNKHGKSVQIKTSGSRENATGGPHMFNLSSGSLKPSSSTKHGDFVHKEGPVRIGLSSPPSKTSSKFHGHSAEKFKTNQHSTGHISQKTKGVSSERRHSSTEVKLSFNKGEEVTASNHSKSKVKSGHSSTASNSSVQKQQVKQSQAVYACHVCMRTFSLRSNLAKHLQNHQVKESEHEQRK